jgi:hypothetical protein
LKNLFGENYPDRWGNGGYSVVDKDNILYTNYNGSVYAFALSDPNEPSAGITTRYMLEDAVTAVQGNNYPANTHITGLSMTYDGHIIITFTNGVAVVDRDLKASSASFYKFGDDEFVTNSIAVDENSSIYVASNTIMHKLVWNGTTLSGDVADGAWSCPYTHSIQPPIIKIGNGTGSTPTLMGFGNDPDKLVVITDGAKDMNLVAFWRNNITPGSNRIAGQIPVTCGFSPLPEWIQSEQSVVVYGYGAFVVNNIPKTVSSDLIGQNNFLQVSLMGPAYPTCYGAERFQWNPSTHTWSSVWARPDVSSTSMIPIHSQSSNMALINGYNNSTGWEVFGLDWTTGKTVHQTIFGNKNFGNGAYAILEYLENEDLIFNSIVGPIRIPYGNAALTVIKSAYPTSYDDVGQTITYHYTVTNSGNIDISAPITVTDDKFGTVSIQNSGILSPGSSITGTSTYKITDADINAGSVTNAAYAKGSFNSQPISSPLTVALVRYKQPTNDKDNNGRYDNGDYGGALAPVVPLPVMSSSPMYGNEPYGPTEIQNSESNVHKTKAHLSKHKHKHKHHSTKHHKNREKTRSIKVDKK